MRNMKLNIMKWLYKLALHVPLIHSAVYYPPILVLKSQVFNTAPINAPIPGRNY